LIPLLRFDEKFYRGYLLGRPNRFTLTVRMHHDLERAYLANPGRLSTIVEEGREVLLVKRGGEKLRKTSFEVFAVKLGHFYVTLRSSLANKIFKAVIEGGLLEDFRGCKVVEEEKPIEDYGRIDFVLQQGKKRIFVEVKSSTHVEDGLAKFPDRPTERGRRHLGKLIELTRGGESCSLVFVVQRPDAEKFTAFREVDPEFAELLKVAATSGVKIKALATVFEPRAKVIYLAKPSLPVML